MKKHYNILFLTCVNLSLLLSGVTEKLNTPEPIRLAERTMKSDTSRGPKVIIDFFNLQILSPSSGVQFYKEGIVFLARSNTEEKMLPTHLSFGTVETYYAILEDTILGKPMLLSSSCHLPYPSEALTFSSDFKTMYFTKVSKKDGKAKIYRAKYSSAGGKKLGWSIDKTPLNFCRGNSNYTHPSLSADGKIMIFASNMTGSRGGMDLFISWKQNETWSAPENLGNAINTKGNEMFPYLDSDNNLFFSSDGLPGYGGYDVFMCKHNDKGWEQPINLTKNINSKQDEMAFTISRKDGKTAFYTKKQHSGTGQMQLYKITLTSINEMKELNKLSDVLYSMALAETDSSAAKTLAAMQNPQTIPPETEKISEILKVDTAGKPKGENIPLPVKMDSDTLKKFIGNPETLLHKDTLIKSEKNLSLVDEKIVKNVIPETKEDEKAIIYRVQVKSSMKSMGKFQISVYGKTYDTYEYFYEGEFRIAIGEFSTLAPARDLQNACRKLGYPQAFVIAQKKNERILDRAVFK